MGGVEGVVLALFQFTPLREGRRLAALLAAGGSAISIHAPPRGATNAEKSGIVMPQDFNSRPSARGDNRRHASRQPRDVISIHAPPRGATAPRRGVRSAVENFNSRPSARGDEDEDERQRK